MLFSGNTTPKEKDTSKREKLKEREKDMFSSATSVQRSPGSAGEFIILNINFNHDIDPRGVLYICILHLLCNKSHNKVNIFLLTSIIFFMNKSSTTHNLLQVQHNKNWVPVKCYSNVMGLVWKWWNYQKFFLQSWDIIKIVTKLLNVERKRISKYRFISFPNNLACGIHFIIYELLEI